MICLTENQTRLMELDIEYDDWYRDNIGKPPSIWDDEYPFEFELLNGKLVVREFTEEERTKRTEIAKKIEAYNLKRDLWIVGEAYSRYGYEVAEWMARVRRVKMPENLYPCGGEQAQCSMFCSKYMKGCTM